MAASRNQNIILCCIILYFCFTTLIPRIRLAGGLFRASWPCHQDGRYHIQNSRDQRLCHSRFRRWASVFCDSRIWSPSKASLQSNDKIRRRYLSDGRIQEYWYGHRRICQHPGLGLEKKTSEFILTK